MGTGIYYFLLILILFVVGKDGPTDRQLKELRENINKLVYTSSNTSVVEVNSEGQIKALSTGTAIIRMNVNDDKFSDEIKVNVVNEKVDARIIENPRIITFDDRNVSFEFCHHI